MFVLLLTLCVSGNLYFINELGSCFFLCPVNQDGYFRAKEFCPSLGFTVEKSRNPAFITREWTNKWFTELDHLPVSNWERNVIQGYTKSISIHMHINNNQDNNHMHTCWHTHAGTHTYTHFLARDAVGKGLGVCAWILMPHHMPMIIWRSLRESIFPTRHCLVCVIIYMCVLWVGYICLSWCICGTWKFCIRFKCC